MLPSEKSAIPPAESSASVGISHMSIASALYTTLQAKHAPTAFHCLRVGQNITAWGLYHQLPLEQLIHFEVLGLLHDIGKIGIPDRILQKPAQLTDEERAIILMHPRVGVEILRSAGLSEIVIQSLDRIGEWFDGTNAGDAKTKLPFAARILSIADAYDAMISEQRYRPAMTRTEALSELRALAGKQFDPRLVQSFAIVAERYGPELHEQVQQRWESYGFRDNVVQLFHRENSMQYGGVAANTLTTVFHRRLTDHMNDGVIFIDTEGKIIEWNRAAEALTSRSRSILCHQHWSPDLIGMRDEAGKEFSESDCPLIAVLTHRKFDVRRLSVQHRDGSRRAIQVQFMPINDDRGTLRGAAMIFDDITRQKNLEQAVQQLHQRATRDPLTKVCNRAELNVQLTKYAEMVHAGKLEASVIITDIDFFKRINDTYGHAAGDEALVAFANVLKKCARSTDLVARYGGEEFVMICSECNLDGAARIAEEIRVELSKNPLPVLRGACLTASFGVAQLTSEIDGESAVNQADAALLRAKQNGRNRVERATDVAEPSAAQENEKEVASPATWLSWLGSRSVTRKQSCDILVSVPRELAIQKISGFLDDWKADTVTSESDSFTIKIETKNAPAYVRVSDRDASYLMKIKLLDADYLPEDEREAARRHTLVRVELESNSRRDRRLSTVDEMMQRVFDSFNRYVVGQIVDEKMRKGVRIHTRR